jgi:hypothetical protein
MVTCLDPRPRGNPDSRVEAVFGFPVRDLFPLTPVSLLSQLDKPLLKNWYLPVAWLLLQYGTRILVTARAVLTIPKTTTITLLIGTNLLKLALDPFIGQYGSCCSVIETPS